MGGGEDEYLRLFHCKFDKEEIIIANNIEKIVTDLLSGVIVAPFELVDVVYEKMGGDYYLRLFIDKEGGISVNDTADLTDIISPMLDTIQPDPFPDGYYLEVTSPGLERPLKTAESLENAVGQYINVSLYQAIDKVKVFEGELISFDGEVLTLSYQDKTRTKTIEIPYQSVAKARLAVKI